MLYFIIIFLLIDYVSYVLIYYILYLFLNTVLLEYVLLPVPKGSPVVYFGGAVARESGLDLYRLLIINPPGSLGIVNSALWCFLWNSVG